jgi:hypothetical protein
MTPGPGPTSRRYCGRLFSPEELEIIRRLIASDAKLNRAQLSRVVCDEFDWRMPDGRAKEMSCRVAMLKMHRAGLITLPPPLKRNGNGRVRVTLTSASDPQPPISAAAGDLEPLRFRIVRTRAESSLWNELIERHHYLRYTPLPGAQLRYFVFSGDRLLAALGFAAAAWALAPRDRFIGWTAEQRKRNLHFVANNARFLIPPWITSRNLASKLLGMAARRLPDDWEQRYGYRPLLLETFVDASRYPGTCYRAANWVDVGLTQGRGKLDRKKRRAIPVKRIFLYPLDPSFRDRLAADGAAPSEGRVH